MTEEVGGGGVGVVAAHRDLCMVIPLLAKTLTENFPSTS